MQEAGVAKLKAELSKYLAHVKAGEEALKCEHWCFLPFLEPRTQRCGLPFSACGRRHADQDTN